MCYFLFPDAQLGQKLDGGRPLNPALEICSELELVRPILLPQKPPKIHLESPLAERLSASIIPPLPCGPARPAKNPSTAQNQFGQPRPIVGPQSDTTTSTPSLGWSSVLQLSHDSHDSHRVGCSSVVCTHVRALPGFPPFVLLLLNQKPGSWSFIHQCPLLPLSGE